MMETPIMTVTVIGVTLVIMIMVMAIVTRWNKRYTMTGEASALFIPPPTPLIPLPPPTLPPLVLPTSILPSPAPSPPTPPPPPPTPPPTPTVNGITDEEYSSYEFSESDSDIW